MGIYKSIRLENTEGRSNKYYRVILNEEATAGTYHVYFEYGPIGRLQGSGMKVEYATLDRARVVYDVLVQSKLRKGYVEVDHTYRETNNSEVQADRETDNSEVQADSNDTVTVTVDDFDATEKAVHCQLLTMIDEEDVERYLRDPDYCAQEKFDGQRKIYRYSSSMGAEVFNRKGKKVDGLGKIKDAMIKLGEDVRPVSFMRMDGEEVGGVLRVFDTMDTDKTYKERYDILKRLVGDDNGVLKVVDMAVTETQKRNLFRRLKEKGREGIVFKRLSSKYVSGKNLDQVKFKFYDEASCIVEAVNTKRSIKVQLMDDEGNMVSVGNCTIPANKEKPHKGEIVEIRYLYAYRGGSLYQPIYKGVRDDIDESACTLSQLKYKSVETDGIEVQDGLINRKIRWK